MLQFFRLGQHPVPTQQKARDCRRSGDDMQVFDNDIGHGQRIVSQIKYEVAASAQVYLLLDVETRFLSNLLSATSDRNALPS